MTLEPGWEWVSELQVDKSKRYGSPDDEGWMYGISFESLIDQIKSGKAEEQTAASIVRRRRFVRSKKCVAPGMNICSPRYMYMSFIDTFLFVSLL